MPLPVIAVGVVIVTGVVGGVAAGVDGGLKMMRAKKTVSASQARHEAALADFRAVEHRVQGRAADYGRLQLEVQAETLGAWVEWLEKNAKRVKLIDRSTVDGVGVGLPNIPELKAQVVQSVNLLKGGAGAAAGAYTAYQAALWGVGSFAAASTGTAISGLTGIAATNATLAWLGGGTLAAGGGGVALGAIMLTGIAVAPAALIGGFAVGVQGHQALTRALEIEASTDKAVAEMTAKEGLLGEVGRRVCELEDVLLDTNVRAVAALDFLDSGDFDDEALLEQFQKTALLMRALGEILSTPLVDGEGLLTSESLTVKEKYAR